MLKNRKTFGQTQNLSVEERGLRTDTGSTLPRTLARRWATADRRRPSSSVGSYSGGSKITHTLVGAIQLTSTREKSDPDCRRFMSSRTPTRFFRSVFSTAPDLKGLLHGDCIGGSWQTLSLEIQQPGQIVMSSIKV